MVPKLEDSNIADARNAYIDYSKCLIQSTFDAAKLWHLEKLPFGSTDGDKYEPKDIIRNGPATIVFWKDGKKTIVKLKEGMPDDPYSAFCAALAKKIFGSGNKVKKMAGMTRFED